MAEQVLKVASLSPKLIASVNQSPESVTYVQVENSGTDRLRRVKVSDGARAIGILSQLDPKEKKILAINGTAHNVEVIALAPSGQEVQGEVSYKKPEQSIMNPDEDASEAEPKAKLNIKAVPSKDSTLESQKTPWISTGQILTSLHAPNLESSS